MLCLALVLDDAAQLAGGRRAVEAENLDRLAGERLLHLFAAVVVERADLARRVAGDDRVTDPERPAMHEHRRHRASPDVEPRLDDRPGRLDLRVCRQLELSIRDEQDLLEQLVEVRASASPRPRRTASSAPLLRLQSFDRELRAHLVGIRVGRVDLVDRDDDRDARGACVRDRLLRLRHHTVVGGYDENCDVGHLGTAGAHCGERLVSRRVEKGQAPSVELGLVCADVLRDPARLGLDDGCLSDRVEERRLAMIDMAHDRDDRRARAEILLGVLEGLGLCVLVRGVLDDHLSPDLCRDQLDRLVGERLRDRDHLAESHHDLDDLGNGDAERSREILDADAGLDRDGSGRGCDWRLTRLPRIPSIARPAGVTSTCPAATGAVDHDAALATRRPAARPDRSIRFVRSLAHHPPV